MQNYKNGSIIQVRPDDYPLILHYGILVNYLGEWWVLHNNESNGVHREKLASILDRSTLIQVIDSKLTGKTTNELLERFKAYEGKSYDLVAYNCETFVNDFINQKKYSKQTIIYTSLILITIVFLTAWITKKLVR